MTSYGTMVDNLAANSSFLIGSGKDLDTEYRCQTSLESEGKSFSMTTEDY